MTKRGGCLLLIVGAQIVVAGCNGWFLHNEETGPLVDDGRQYVKPDITSAELIEARGYVAKEFKFTTRDGYHLTVTRGTNPLINKGERGLDNKLPLLFVNPATFACNVFLINSAGVRPKVYDTKRVNVAQLTTDKLAAMTKGDPSVRSLAFLAMNFGHEVWLLDRRGFGQSRGKAGHENRTLIEALKSVPTSLLGNVLDGFSLSAGLEPRRQPRANEMGADDGAAANERQKRQAESVSEASKTASGGSSSDNARRPATTTRQSGSSGSDLLPILSILANFKSKLTGISHEQALSSFTKRFIHSFDPDYWRFSLDENAAIDFPEAIDLVLKETGKSKLHAIGMSAGGATILLSLAAQPDLANKISKAVLWAPSVNMSPTSDIVYLLGLLIPIFQGYEGALPMPIMMPVLEKIILLLCGPKFMQRTVCEQIVDGLFGFSGGQAPIRPFISSNSFRPTSSFELMQLGQFARTKTPCMLQMNSKRENMDKYGQEKAPCYDLGQIKLHNISFYVGKTDTLVSPDDVRTTIRQMKVPVESHFIVKRGLFFNHAGFFIHDENDKLAVLPSMLDIERSELQQLHSSQL